MTYSNSTPSSAPSNTHTRPAETVAERHREAYVRGQRQAPSLWARLRPWAIGTIAGLLIGGAAAFAASYQVLPVRATHLERVFLTIDGRNAFLVSGDVVFDSTPLPTSPAPSQP